MSVQPSPRRWTAGRVAATAVLGAAALALLVWLVIVPATRVQAATFTVNVTTDGNDLTPGDGVCDSDGAGGNQCSLRAAIQEANADPSSGTDVIAFSVASPVVLAAALPAIAENSVTIDGGGHQVSMTAPGIAFTISADAVHMNGLVIDGEGVGTTGILVNNFADDVVVDGLTVRGFTSAGFHNAIGAGGDRNIVRNSTFTANSGNGIFLDGGVDNVILNNFITDNGDAAGEDGLDVSWVDNLLIQGNTFSGNFDAQILIDSLGARRVTIIQNTITAGSDGIVIGAGVDAAADIDVGLSVDNRNVFRGTIAAPAEQYMRVLSAVNVNAIFNDWNAYTDAAIEGVICHDGDAGCGPGVVDFEPFIATPSPLPTATPTPTITPTPGEPTVTPTTGPGEVETVALIAGCNPLAWTGPNGTPAGTIASAVSPAGILVALWQFEGGVWLGYSPQFPDVSDLTSVDRLDVVFVCVNAAGTFSRPVI